MNTPEVVFAVVLAGVLVAVTACIALVIREARRSDGLLSSSQPVSRLMLPRQIPDDLNRFAFYAHRISGLAILAFLGLHILDVSVFAISKSTFNQMHDFYGTPEMRIFECALLFAILFHAFNGLRVVAIDFVDLGPVAASRLLTVVLALTVALGIAGSVVIVAPIF
jgi:succinate dehydrogenase / fumarate reductase, cytochrome b subunit